MTAPEPGRPAPNVALASYPAEVPALPDRVIEGGSYSVRFARSPGDLDRVLRLRYEVFNVELGEGLDDSHATGRDEDDLDSGFHHLMICTRRDDAIVGTYRMQTAGMARSHGGFYSDREFDLSGLPAALVEDAVEIGRACVAQGHRNGRVLHLLWRGLAAYLSWNRKSHLFGCCSVSTIDPAVGAAVHRELDRLGALHPTLSVRPRPAHRCAMRPGGDMPGHVPALFRSYLTLGAQVVSPPAIDRAFKTIDWLVMLDVSRIHPVAYRTFFR